MTQFRKFEDLQVWQKSRDLVKVIRSICKRPCMRRDFSLMDQITRSARSISTNIAEGCDAMTVPEFIHFLGYSQRSASETRGHLYDLMDETYITKQEFLQLRDRCEGIGCMLAKLIHHLQKLDPQQKRTLKLDEETNQQKPPRPNQTFKCSLFTIACCPMAKRVETPQYNATAAGNWKAKTAIIMGKT